MQLESISIPRVIAKLLKHRTSISSLGDVQRILSEDQKHSSPVAEVHYQKQRSREVALKGRVPTETLRCEGFGGGLGRP